MKKLYIIMILLLLLLSTVILVVLTKKTENTQTHNITNFEECANAGNPIMESYPRKCTTGGKIYVENIGNELEKSNLVLVNSPRPNTSIKSPFTITGQARGSWFFEAQFPVQLFNSTGELLAEGFATAEGEWMTEEFVPFTATLTFDALSAGKGELMLIKANPSDLPENADELVIPVVFE